MSFFLLITGTLCVAALLPLGLLAYFGSVRLVLVPVAALFGAIFLGATGALLGLPVDILLESGPAFTAGGAAIGVVAGAVAGVTGALRRSS